jgi:hypothetical protein
MSDIDDQNLNFTREAFLHPINLVMLLGTSMSAYLVSDMGLLSNLIFSLAFGTELMYLGIVPRLPRFKKMIRLKKLRERDASVEEKALFQQLDANSQRRFLMLKHLTRLIRQNFEKMPYTSQGMLESIRKKIDELLSNYLSLLDLQKRYQLYMDTDLQHQLAHDINEEQQAIEEASSERLKATKQRRLLILKKRLGRLKSAREKYEVSQSHLDTIEDAIRYIYEQSMTLNDPEEIGFQLDNLLMEVEETSQLIEDLDREIDLDLDTGEVDLSSSLQDEQPETELETKPSEQQADQRVSGELKNSLETDLSEIETDTESSGSSKTSNRVKS